MLIFELSRPGRRAAAQSPREVSMPELPARFLRAKAPALPEVSELQAVRHYTQLSQKNFSIDTHFYPLGSCTMKYNPRVCNSVVSAPGLLNRHPLAPEEQSQGFLACLWELQDMLAELTGMSAVALSPMAGAQGEFAGVAMIRAYHEARGDTARREILVPDAAHGTNPASAVMCGYEVHEIPTDDQGDVDLEALKAALGPKTAGLMLTNPSTLGVFERHIAEIAELVHSAGGLLYYDGANLNAILGKTRPGDMGFDVMHMNLHKTFATPHGGGGPGAGAVAANDKLAPYLPIPGVGREGERYFWITEKQRPATIGRLSAFAGNAGVLLRAYAYLRLIGREGAPRVADYAVLNANYLMARLKSLGFEIARPDRRATHEFIVSLKKQAHDLGVTARDFAKRLLDFGIHAPTTYFPLTVPECLLIEPTETEAKDDLDALVEAMRIIQGEAETKAEWVRQGPYTLPNRRLDETRAARELNVKWAIR